jgi:hypothetical protein
MKRFHSTSLSLLFVFIIFACLYYDCSGASVNEYEGFTPRIREMYRPYLRHSRIFTHKVYNHHKNNIHNLFRKFGLM